MNRSRFAAPALCRIAVALSGLLASGASLAAQAGPAAAKALDLGVYGGYLGSNPGYGSYHNTGDAFGLEVSHSFAGFSLTPALEFRANLTNGAAVRERTYLPGVRLTGTLLHVLHPYGTFLIGVGTLRFNLSNLSDQSDNSIVYSAGGGLQLDVARHFQIMGDFQYQHWDFGRGDTITPNLVLFGVSYHIPFRPYNSHAMR